jgi:hypothetical protein
MFRLDEVHNSAKKIKRRLAIKHILETTASLRFNKEQQETKAGNKQLSVCINKVSRRGYSDLLCLH